MSDFTYDERETATNFISMYGQEEAEKEAKSLMDNFRGTMETSPYAASRFDHWKAVLHFIKDKAHREHIK